MRRSAKWTPPSPNILCSDFTTNIPFLRAVVTHPAFARGDVTTHFIEDHLRDWKMPKVKDELLIAKAVAEFLGLAIIVQLLITNYQRMMFGMQRIVSAWERNDEIRLSC